MGEAAMKTIRTSFHALFKSYHALASVAALLVFPVSAAALLSQSMTVSSPILATISSRFAFLFEAAGLPPSSQFCALLNLKISQTLFTFVSTLPFTLTLLVLAKASIFGIVIRRSNAAASASLLRLYPSLALTHLFNALLVLSANAAVFAVLFLAFNVLDILRLSSNYCVLLAFSSAGVILYSFVLANATVVCNLSIIILAFDGGGGYLSVLKALVFVRGRAGTAMTLSLPASLGMAAVEALFQYRVMKPYRRSAAAGATLHPSVIWEAFLIIYMYSFLVVFDTVITCIFLESCKNSVESSRNKMYDLDFAMGSEDMPDLQV